jgi:hypothetical protein
VGDAGGNKRLVSSPWAGNRIHGFIGVGVLYCNELNQVLNVNYVWRQGHCVWSLQVSMIYYCKLLPAENIVKTTFIAILTLED